MFKKIILYLCRVGGDTELTLAIKCGVGQSTIDRIKNGQMPRWDVGDKLLSLYDELQSTESSRIKA